MRIVPLLSFALLAGGCDVFTHSCTHIGCLDGVTLELKPVEAGFAGGQYTLELLADRERAACSFAIPDSLPQPGSATSIDCDPGLGAFIQQVAVCTETRTADAISQSCRPLPGRHTLSAQLQATPRSLEVRLVRDGATLIEHALTPTYETSHPNGPDCDPACHQASITLDLP
jgi:hypothetical protein